MNAQQEAVAYWKFCEDRQLRPSVRKTIEHLRSFGIPVTETKAYAWLKKFSAHNPHPKCREQRKMSTEEAHPVMAEAQKRRLRAHNIVSLFPDVLSPIGDNAAQASTKKKTRVEASKQPKPPKPVAEWLSPLAVEFEAIQGKTLGELLLVERVVLARTHQALFCNNARDERKNRRAASLLISALGDMARQRPWSGYTCAEYVDGLQAVMESTCELVRSPWAFKGALEYGPEPAAAQA